MKRPPIKVPPAWAVVDCDGRVLWGLVFTNKREVSQCAKHPKRRIVRLYAFEVRKAKRGKR